MKYMISLALILFSFSLFPQQETSRNFSWSSSAGLNFAFDSIACKLGSEATPNHFNLLYSTLEYDIDVSDYLTAGIIAGYKMSSAMKDDLQFSDLPLTLLLDRKNGMSQGLLLGVNLHSTPFSFGDFSIRARGDFVFSLSGKNEYAIDLDVVTGTALVKENFSLFTVDLLLQYEGFSAINIFAGMRLNMLNGKYTVSETIEDLSGDTILKFKQKNLMGPMAGVTWELGSSWEFSLKASLISRFSAALSVLYSL